MDDQTQYYFGSTTAAAPAGSVTSPAEIGRETTGLEPAADGSGYRIDRYRLLEVLGTGSFGTVYLARDEHLDRLVAIKLPKLDRIVTEADVQGYVFEARKVAALDHANIVPVYDIGRGADGRCYLVSKFIAGGDLTSWCDAKLRSLREIASSMMQIALALDHSHRHGLIHRDIKPANILVDSVGQSYLADFGLALYSGSSSLVVQFAGSPAYMSPEQTTGDVRKLDGRSDIFSLGIVFYELLAGRRPFAGQTLNELHSRIRDHEPPALSAVRRGVPESLARICMSCLAKNPNDRFNSAAVLAQSLSVWLAQDERMNNAQAVSHDPWPPNIVAWLAGALLVCVVAFTVIALNEFVTNGVKPPVPSLPNGPWLVTAGAITASIAFCLFVGARFAIREGRRPNWLALAMIALLFTATGCVWWALSSFSATEGVPP